MKLSLSEARSRNLIGSAILFSVFANLLLLTGPLFMLLVYDRVLGSRSEETLTALFMLVAALFALYGVLEFARGRLLARVGARLHSAYQRRVFLAVLESGAKNRRTAESQSAFQDLDVLQGFFASSAPVAFMDLVWVPLFLLVIFVFHPFLGWVATGGAVALVVLAIANQLLTRRRTQHAQTRSVEAANFARQSEYAIETVWGQGMGGAMADRWMAMQDRAIGHGVGAADWTNSFGAASRALRLLMQSTILAAGAWLVLQDQITAGAMIAASIVLGRALAPIEQTIAQWPLVQRARAAWRSLSDFLEEVRAPARPMPLPRPSPGLSVRRVAVAAAAQGQMPVLRDVAFDVGPGEVLGVIGKSGAGKTTLARVLVGLTPCAVGVVRLGGASLLHYDRDALGALIGYLPQEIRMFDGTVAENIARMTPDPDPKAVLAAARKANAHQLILSLPDGYDTPVRAVNATLSGGQRQRIALARAFFGDPVLTVLDEPNSALDSEGSSALRAALEGIKREGRAAVMMTHRPTEIEVCDTLLVLDGGRVVAHGPREEILRSMVRNAERLREQEQQKQRPPKPQPQPQVAS